MSWISLATAVFVAMSPYAIGSIAWAFRIERRIATIEGILKVSSGIH